VKRNAHGGQKGVDVDAKVHLIAAEWIARSNPIGAGGGDCQAGLFSDVIAFGKTL
jgi:hypothetical protein